MTVQSKHAALTLVCIALAALPIRLSALDQQPNNPGQEQSRTGPTDPAELEAFLDGLILTQLHELNIAGAVVSVVKGGELFFSKGYGYADREAREKPDPETTLFRIGSISKLFTWTSVMQLVEEGKLDLDTDINEYLRDFQIPDTYPEPITLRHVMSHSAGFEDWVIGLFANDEEKLRPLGEILSEQLPARVRPPGVTSSYSNHATGMAAYIVEVTSGKRWEDFVQERILDPLEMEYATFDQPLSAGLAAHMSKGYNLEDGELEEKEFEFVPLAPVGAASVSATAMAKFMVAHLQLGRYGESRILEETTARTMQSESYRMAPGVNAMVHGFMDLSGNGQRIIGHGGDTFWFHSMLALFPEHDLGVFVSYNSAGGGAATEPFLTSFLDRYFPVADEPIVAPADFAERAARFTGSFRSNRFSHTSAAKIAALGSVDVVSTDEGTLRFKGGIAGEWIEVAPLTFREKFGSDRIVFREADDGSITHFFLAQVPIMAFERVPVVERRGLVFFVFLFAGISIVVTLVSWPAGWVARRLYQVSGASQVRMPATTRLVLWAAALLYVLFVLGIAALLSDPIDLVNGNTGGLSALLLLPVIGGLLTLFAVYLAVQLWRKGSGRLLGRIAYSGATFSFVLLVWQLNVWRLLGWHL